MLDRLTGLQVLVRVAALGSLSAAARDLAMSQTMATKHMAALETRLGIKLLHRTTRRLTLTEAGRTYLEAAERVLDDLAEADAAVAIEGREARGTLRLSAPVSFGISELAGRLPALCARHPGLHVDLGLNDRHVDLVEEGWDMAVRIGSVTDQTLIARKLAPCWMVACAAPSYLAQHGTPRHVADLAGHACLHYTLSRATGPDRWRFGRDGRVSVSVKGALKANNGDALVAAAIAGQGIIYQPSFLVARALSEGRLVTLALDHAPTELDGIFAVYPATRRPPAKVRAAIDFLVEQFSQPPPRELVAS